MEKVKILAVDDETGVLNVIKTILRHYDLTTIASSYEAADLIKQNKYDVFIVDYQMPGLDGIEIFKLIRAENEQKKHVNIFLTASGTLYLFKNEILDGLFDFVIEKPFETNDFKKVFDKAIIKLGKMRNKEIES